MQVLTAKAIDALLDYPSVIDAVKHGFCADIKVPTRHHHTMERAGGNAAHLLMPAWHGEGGTQPALFLGVKVVNVFPGNGARGLPSVMGTYLLMSGITGAPLAVMDGARLTLWRTAAASALAARSLAAPNAKTHLMVGAGALSPFLIRAHACVRPIIRHLIWNRNTQKARALAQQMRAAGLAVDAVETLEAAAREADIISCATLSHEPLIKGAWLKPGAHLDLVGAFTPQMRESDDEAIRRARVFVDTRDGALKEGGDLVQPLASGLIQPDKVEADLFDLCRGTFTLRRAREDITLFKSVGTAIEDLAAASLIAARLGLAP